MIFLFSFKPLDCVDWPLHSGALKGYEDGLRHTSCSCIAISWPRDGLRGGPGGKEGEEGKEGVAPCMCILWGGRRPCKVVEPAPQKAPSKVLNPNIQDTEALWDKGWENHQHLLRSWLCHFSSWIPSVVKFNQQLHFQLHPEKPGKLAAPRTRNGGRWQRRKPPLPPSMIISFENPENWDLCTVWFSL